MSGLLMGAVFGLSPVFFTDLLKSKSDVAFFMFNVIYGGMVFQYSVGRWLDTTSKPFVLTGVCLSTFTIILLTPLWREHFWVLWILTGLTGVLIFILYPVSISLTCDVVSQKDIVQATQSLLLIYSTGVMLGPFIASLFMHAVGLWGPHVLFGLTAIIFLPWFVGAKQFITGNNSEDYLNSSEQEAQAKFESS